MGGDTSPNNPGTYGTLGTASQTNFPGSREASVMWFDSDAQQLWVFGGLGYGTTNSTTGTLFSLLFFL